MRVLKAHYFLQTREKSITFSKLQKSNVKTKDWTVICKQIKIGIHKEIDMGTRMEIPMTIEDLHLTCSAMHTL